MLFTSQFILQECCFEKDFPGLCIYPWAHKTTNQRSSEKLNRKVYFPDVNPSKNGHKMSMYAGDFLEIFKKPNDFSVVATCFFLDTGRNAIDYIEHIYHILKPGGLWVNNGPLLYHYAENPKKTNQVTKSSAYENEFYKTEGSVEFTLEEIFEICKKIRFEIIDKKEIPLVYNSDRESLVGYQYKSQFWTCRKPL